MLSCTSTQTLWPPMKVMHRASSGTILRAMARIRSEKNEMLSKLVRWGGLAAMLSGALWVVKGGAILLGLPDPDLFIPAQLFFALGLLGLHAWLTGWGGWLVRICSSASSCLCLPPGVCRELPRCL